MAKPTYILNQRPVTIASALCRPRYGHGHVLRLPRYIVLTGPGVITVPDESLPAGAIVFEDANTDAKLLTVETNEAGE